MVDGIEEFKRKSQYEVLIISYETFRLHHERLMDPKHCQLVICDEAHRLKNKDTLTTKTLASLPCRRRVLLSGTPMQNGKSMLIYVGRRLPRIIGPTSSETVTPSHLPFCA